MMRALSARLGRMRIRLKVFLSMALVMLAAIGLIGVFSYHNARSITSERYAQSLESALRSLAADIENRALSMKEQAEMLAWNNELRTILSRDMEGYSFSDQLEDLKTLEKLLSLTGPGASVRVYVRGGPFYARERQRIFPLSEIEGSPLYQDMILSGGGFGLSVEKGLNPAREVQMLTCLRPVRDAANIFENVGAVSVSMECATLEQMLLNAKLTPNSAVLLLDGETLLCASGRPLDEAALRQVVEGAPMEGETLLARSIDELGWTLAALIPEGDINEPLGEVVRFYLLLSLGVLAVVLLLAVGISAGVTRRITCLAQRIASAPDPMKLEFSPVEYEDEIGRLQKTYNQMIQANRALIEDVYLARILKREAELKALQARINPHFLYNTLDTLNWMALEVGADRVSRLVDLLARFFRMSLGRGEGRVKVRDELEHARVYLEIQKYRLEQGLCYEIQVEEPVLSAPILPLTLQPLVENAVIHGVQMSPNQSGCVRIYGRVEADCACLCVEDDGPGLSRPPETLLSPPEDPSAGGYGVYNTDQRLKLAFGNRFGLSYERPRDGGVRVVITLPLPDP